MSNKTWSDAVGETAKATEQLTPKELFSQMSGGRPGALTLRIAPNGFTQILVDGEVVGLVQKLTLHLNAQTIIPEGEVEILAYGHEQSPIYIERLKSVPWLKVMVTQLEEPKALCSRCAGDGRIRCDNAECLICANDFYCASS